MIINLSPEAHEKLKTQIEIYGSVDSAILNLCEIAKTAWSTHTTQKDEPKEATLENGVPKTDPEILEFTVSDPSHLPDLTFSYMSKAIIDGCELDATYWNHLIKHLIDLCLEKYSVDEIKSFLREWNWTRHERLGAYLNYYPTSKKSARTAVRAAKMLGIPLELYLVYPINKGEYPGQTIKLHV